MSRKKLLTGLHISAIRGLLRISQEELGKRAKVSGGKIKNAEKFKYIESGTVRSIKKIIKYLEEKEIGFFEDDTSIGISISKSELKKMEDKENKK